MKKTFLLGVGAQRSGTTWLHRYLSSHPNVDFGFTKEYHIFDALYINEDRIKQLYLQERINAVLDSRQRAPSAADIRLLSFIGNPNRYFDYFRDLLQSRDDLLVTGDITPSYAGLSAETFRRIRAELVERALEIKVVFLMRDPVDRCISSARQISSRRRSPLDKDSEAQFLRDFYKTGDCRMRTRYDLTIRNLEDAFSPGEIDFFFFEEFFDSRSIRHLTDRLGIDYADPHLEQRVNETVDPHPVEEDLQAEIFAYYGEVYRFAAERFGKAHIETVWPRYRDLGSAAR